MFSEKTPFIIKSLKPIEKIEDVKARLDWMRHDGKPKYVEFGCEKFSTFKLKCQIPSFGRLDAEVADLSLYYKGHELIILCNTRFNYS